MRNAISTQKISVANKYRSSRPEMFYKNGVFRNFAKFTVKHLCQGLFFNKVAGLRPCKISKNTFSYRTLPLAASLYGLLTTRCKI